MEIYKITNKITGDFYIGKNSTSNPKYLGSGVELQKQIAQYGKENFIKQILCVITSELINDKILSQIESVYISNHIENPKCINISLGCYQDKKNVQIKYINKIEYVEKIKYITKPIKYISGRSLASLL